MKISDVDELEREKIQWVLDRALEVSGNKKIISERQIKFSLFGQMISGIPDLIFENENDLIVWDFKTGERVVENEESYWFQLMCYAHAYAKTKHFTPEKMIPLTLVYLDSKQVVTKEVSHREISQILFEKWSKTESLDQVNLKHCSHCEYVSICLHTKRTAH